MAYTLTDHHIHIGQFEEICYDTREVFEIVLESDCVKNFYYSSCTSCKSGVHYSEVAQEIESALKLAGCGVATPLFWFIPEYINQNINIEQVMKDLPYGGFKLHPLANEWNFAADTKQTDALQRIFDYAVKSRLKIFIHTGESGVDSPDRFERFFAEYPDAEIVLAHGRPAGKTIEMLKAFSNLLCDTAFMPRERFDIIAGAGFVGRILTGSDFPITHYFENKYPTEGRATDLSLKEQYQRDILLMRHYQTLIRQEGETNALSSEI